MKEIDFRCVIDEANYSKVGKEWERVVAIYPYNRIYYVTEGKAEIVLKNKTIVLEPGFIYFIPAFTVMRSILIEPMGHYYIHFAPTNTTFNKNFLKEFMLETKVKGDELTLLAFKNAMDYRFNKSTKDRLMLDSLLNMLMAKLIKENPHPKKPDWAIEIEDFIIKNLSSNITVQSLADKTGYDRTYFSILFKEIFKISPKEYIIEERIKTAQMMLAKKDYSMAEICEQTGFISTMYFSRIFKKKTGFAPSDYRKKLLA